MTLYFATLIKPSPVKTYSDLIANGGVGRSTSHSSASAFAPELHVILIVSTNDDAAHVQISLALVSADTVPELAV